MDEDSGILDVWAVRFGPAQNMVRFIVCEPIDTPLEIGGDTYCVDGQWPSLMLHGDEKKDKGYIGTVTKREDMPEADTERTDRIRAGDERVPVSQPVQYGTPRQDIHRPLLSWRPTQHGGSDADVDEPAGNHLGWSTWRTR